MKNSQFFPSKMFLYKKSRNSNCVIFYKYLNHVDQIHQDWHKLFGNYKFIESSHYQNVGR